MNHTGSVHMKCYSPEKKGGLLERGGGFNQRFIVFKKRQIKVPLV